MSAVTFATQADAIAAGYRSPVRKGENRNRDVSGPNKFGYVFQDSEGNETITVWFTEDRNKGRGYPSFAPMFPPQ